MEILEQQGWQTKDQPQPHLRHEQRIHVIDAMGHRRTTAPEVAPAEIVTLPASNGEPAGAQA